MDPWVVGELDDDDDIEGGRRGRGIVEEFRPPSQISPPRREKISGENPALSVVKMA